MQGVSYEFTEGDRKLAEQLLRRSKLSMTQIADQLGLMSTAPISMLNRELGIRKYGRGSRSWTVGKKLVRSEGTEKY